MRDQQRLACFDALCEMFNIIKALEYRIPLDDAEEMLPQCDLFLAHYNWLAAFPAQCLRLNYHFTVKCHPLWHVCNFALYLNPSVSACYEFEDFITTMIACAKSCVASSRRNNKSLFRPVDVSWFVGRCSSFFTTHDLFFKNYPGVPRSGRGASPTYQGPYSTHSGNK